ncbi:MAG: right-handed parallel beta-helix repeat-containing protein [Bacteroidales bacterium]|nr:right-handed parallel beta-helix repeat-containing protein [Bacteroidales bacterium]
MILYTRFVPRAASCLKTFSVLAGLLAVTSVAAQKLRDYPILKELNKQGFEIKQIREVSTIKEFIEALDNNTAIILNPGDYYFTDSDILGDEEEQNQLDNFEELSTHYTDNYIHELHDLAIIAKGEERPRFLQPDGYNHVMKFRDVENLFMQNLFLGHETAGYCMGGVLLIYNGENILLDQMVLSGSGTEGLSMIDITDLKITNSLITESSEQLATFSNVHDAVLEECNFLENNVSLRGFAVYHSNLTFTDCTIREIYDFYYNPWDYYGSSYDVMFVIDDYDFGEWYIDREADPVPEDYTHSLIGFENTTINDELVNHTYDLSPDVEYEEYEEYYEEYEEEEDWNEGDYEEEEYEDPDHSDTVYD